MKRHALEITAQRGVAANDIDQPHAFAFEQLHAGDFAANQVAFGRDHGLGKELFARPVRQQVCHAVTFGQDARGDEIQIHHTPGDQDQTQGGDFENREWFHAVGACHTIDQQVGRSADQGQRTTQNGRIGQRDQQL